MLTIKHKSLSPMVRPISEDSFFFLRDEVLQSVGLYFILKQEILLVIIVELEHGFKIPGCDAPIFVNFCL